MRTCRGKDDCVFIGGVLLRLCARGGVVHCWSIAIRFNAHTDFHLCLPLGVLDGVR